jgi:HSP20 family protein
VVPKSKDDPSGRRRIQSDVDRLFLDLLRGERVPLQGPAAFRPNADVYFHQSERAVVVKMELAGIDPDRITLEIEGNVLRVSGTRTDRRPPDAVYHQMEISYGRFERVVMLPPEVDIARASADYSAGYLEIRVPIRQRSTARQIPITPHEEQDGGRER